MSASTSNEAVRYYSRYTHGVDDKRRIQIPAKWRPAQVDMEWTLILWENAGSCGACLRVYPPKQMEALLARIEGMSTSDPAAVALRRNIAKNCEPVTMDKAGRICLPEEIAAKAGIEKQVVLAGALQWFEIWNPERYALASAGDDALAPESVRSI
jgi:MraZ protein